MRLGDLLGDLEGVGTVDQHRELVAAQAGDRVFVADHRGEPGAVTSSRRSPSAWPKRSFTDLNRSRSQ